MENCRERLGVFQEPGAAAYVNHSEHKTLYHPSSVIIAAPSDVGDVPDRLVPPMEEL